MAKSVLDDLRDLMEKALAAGTVRVWGKDKVKFQKQRDGSWVPMGKDKPKAAQGRGTYPVFRSQDKPGPKTTKKVPKPPKPVGATPVTPKVEIPVGRKWIDKAPGLPESTMEEHFKDDEPKPTRKALHEHIQRTFSSHVKPVEPGTKPIALVMMGGPASGKSSIVKGVAKSDFVQVDPDAIKEMIPEYKEGVEKGARNAAFMVHDESSYIAKQIHEQAVKDHKNVIIDGTGKNAEKYLKMIRDFKEQGYHVQLMMPHVPGEKGLARAKARAEHTGRWVPEDIIKDAYAKIPKNFERIAELADEAALFDTDRDPATLVYEKKDGKSVDKDVEFMKKFREENKNESVVRDLETLFESEDDDDCEEIPEDATPAFTLKDIVKRAREGLKTKEVSVGDETEPKFKRSEGVEWPVDDDHIG